LRRKPAGKKDSGRSEALGEINPDLPDFGKMMMRRGMIEELCEREANIV
jgi:hypothetical protein